jgi:hypothetical protein
MEYFPFGAAPSQLPEWLQTSLAGTALGGASMPLWMLDTTEDLSVPAAFMLKMPPGYRLFRHGHPCERFEVVVQGSLDVGDGRTAEAGDVFTALAGTLYGPHTAGPEGCTTIEIFSALEGIFRVLYEGPEGELLEADVRNGELPPDYEPLAPDGSVVDFGIATAQPSA